MYLPNLGNYFKIRNNFKPMIPFQVFVITAPANAHNPAQNGYGVGLLLLPDKVVSYFDSLAKKAAAFFKISRSIRSFLTSLRSRSISSFSGLICPLPGKAWLPLVSNCFIQRLRELWWMPRFRAASDTL
jgi:hypothetical protein